MANTNGNNGWRLLMADQIRLLHQILDRLPPQADELPPYRAIERWRRELVCERAVEPVIFGHTVFKPHLDSGAPVLCGCHHKPMLLALTAGREPEPICIYAAWFALLRARWPNLPESPMALYRSSHRED